MNNSVSHYYFEDISVRAVIIDDSIWFIAKDVCNALQIAHTGSAIRSLDDDERGVHLTHTLSGRQEMSIINESGLYTLILRCRDAVKPGTVPHRFRKWVTNEVLPAIRKTGRYEHPVSKPSRPAREPLNQNDLRNLSWLVQDMVRTLRFQGVWSNAIWLCLRRATGVSSPQSFSTSDLPLLAQECRRIMMITGLVNEKVARFEREAVRRILRNREDCSKVLRQLESELDSFELEPDNVRNLERYERLAIDSLESRAQF